MTDVNTNTFQGANQGAIGGYVPDTTIESSKMDDDLSKVKNDLDYHLSVLQNIYSKLDTIETNATVDQSASEIVSLINASANKIDLDNLDDTIAILQDIIDAVASHRITTVAGEMHPETSIKSTELSYSNTPTSVITSCTNLLDEIKNVRYQIHRLVGKTNWIDAPAATLESLQSQITADEGDLVTHAADMAKHLTADQNAALDGANAPSVTNVIATMNDLGTAGYGDMLKGVYDTNNNGVVDKAAGLTDGELVKTFTDIASKITTDIATHTASASAHHVKYTNGEAINAINTDTDHGTTAQHNYFSGDYGDLANKPSIAYASTIAADDFTQTEVNNLRAGKLDNGTTPWTYRSLVTKTSSYTTTLTDETILCDTSGGSFTITLPTATGSTGKIYNIKKMDSSSHVLTIDAYSSQTIDGGANVTISTQYECITVQSTGTGWVII